MMGFRDMTFCTHWEECTKGEICHRALTQEVHEQAERWWGSPDYPIVTYVDHPKPHCFDPIAVSGEGQ